MTHNKQTPSFTPQRHNPCVTSSCCETTIEIYQSEHTDTNCKRETIGNYRPIWPRRGDTNFPFPSLSSLLLTFHFRLFFFSFPFDTITDSTRHTLLKETCAAWLDWTILQIFKSKLIELRYCLSNYKQKLINLIYVAQHAKLPQHNRLTILFDLLMVAVELQSPFCPMQRNAKKINERNHTKCTQYS